MPLYDYVCAACGHTQTLLHRHSEAPVCPSCTSPALVKQLSPFSALTAKARPIAETTRTPLQGAAKGSAAVTPADGAASGQSHVCGSTCSHGSKTKTVCATDAHAASLVQKYLG